MKRVAANGHRLPDPIRIGEIFSDVTKKQWKIGRSIGIGGFGEIYLASDEISKSVGSEARYVIKVEPHDNGPLFVETNFYVRAAKSELIDRWTKLHKLKMFGMPRFVGLGSHVYKGLRYRFLVLDRFGTDLEKLFLKNGCQFHVKTALTLAIQTLDILEYIHSQGYVHGDIKASNLLLGLNDHYSNQVYLLDYGLATHYADNNGNHKEYCSDERTAHQGTIEYTSRDAHIGASSRRGDLEILGYNLLQWLCGKLPWEKHSLSPSLVHEQKKVLMTNIPELLRSCFPKNPAPPVLGNYLKYVANLKFHETPDYTFCKKLLRQGIRDAGYIDDSLLEFDNPDFIQRAKRLKKVGRKRKLGEPENIIPIFRLISLVSSPRQPCMAMTQNNNRVTRNSPPTMGQFSWEDVLSSNPEKKVKRSNANMLATPPVVHETSNKTRCSSETLTSAMLDVKAGRWSEIVLQNLSRRSKGNSVSMPYGTNLTPAMEQVIRNRKTLEQLELHNICDKTHTIATMLSLRSGKIRQLTPQYKKLVYRKSIKPAKKKAVERAVVAQKMLTRRQS